MNWKEHLWIGILSSGIFAVGMFLKYDWFKINEIIIPQLLAVILLSGLVPDLDHENGKLHQWLIGLGLLLALAGLGFAYFGIGINNQELIMSGVLLSAGAFFMGEFSNHRGFWHSIPACIIYGVIVGFILQNFQLGVVGFVGYYSHLVADSIPFKIK